MAKRIEEKRRYLRLNIPLEIEYVLSDADRVFTATTKDISASGIRFTAKDGIPENRNLDIKLKIPNSANPVHAQGRVAWSKKVSLENDSPLEIGIEFMKIEEDNKNTFLKYLCDLIYG